MVFIVQLCNCYFSKENILWLLYFFRIIFLFTFDKITNKLAIKQEGKHVLIIRVVSMAIVSNKLCASLF